MKKRNIVVLFTILVISVLTSIGIFVFPKSVSDKTGNRYRTIKVKGQIWIAENLRTPLAKKSYCYDNTEANCLNFGRLYTRDAARKVCQDLGKGWRLPDTKDWDRLIWHFGHDRGVKDAETDLNFKKAYYQLIKDGKSGFNALLGGYSVRGEHFFDVNNLGYYWADNGSYYKFYGYERKVLKDGGRGSVAFSCRCVKGF